MKFDRKINSNWTSKPRTLSMALGLFVLAMLSPVSGVAGSLQEEPQITLEMLQDAIGKVEDSKEISDIEKLSKIKPERLVFDEGATVFLIWKTLGLEVLFEKAKARTIFLQGADVERQYTEFPANLPLGLKFNESRRDVERKLGPPDEISGGEVIEVWTTYKKPKISIFYKSENLSDFDAKIKSVTIQ